MEIGPAASNRDFAKGLARAFAGALIFGLPLLMTMEMWWLGFLMEPGRIALLMALFFPFLVALSWHAGFEPTFSWRDDVVDALVALAVGFACAALMLGALGVLQRDLPLADIVGKLCLQAVPGSIGALLAQTMLGERETHESEQGGGGTYASEVFIMAVGALFLAFNLAPTDEMMLIAARISPWHAVVLVLGSLAIMHAFVYSLAFRGQHDPAEAPGLSLFLRFTIVGYALAVLLSAYLLWSFGRLGGLPPLEVLKAAIVLGVPAALGAAAARLIL